MRKSKATLLDQSANCRTVFESLESRSLLSATPSGLLHNVPAASSYKLVYDLDVPKLGGSLNTTSVPYSVNNSATVTQPFDRIGYYVELAKSDGTTQWVFASADAFTANAKKIGVPTTASGEFYQLKLTNLDVASNVAGVVSGTGLAGGNIEFWPKSYGPANAASVPGASSTAYDFGDSTMSGGFGYGSMQIHNSAAKQTLFAYNDWGGENPTQPAEIGIGNSPTSAADWTHNNTGDLWSTRRIQVLVHLRSTVPPIDPTAIKVLALGDSITWGYTPNVVLSGGYRSRFYSDLVTAGKKFQFVGSVQDVYSTMLLNAHEEFHEGHGGFRTDQVLGNLTGIVNGSNVSSNNGGHWLDGTDAHPAVNPDVILLHIGTNDFLQGRSPASAAGNLDKIIAKLTTLRPSAKIFVSNIMPIANPGQNASVKAYNQLVENTVVPKYQAMGKSVVFVNQYANFVDAQGKLVANLLSKDGVHPVRAGYDKIGDTWAAAVLSALRKKTPTGK